MARRIVIDHPGSRNQEKDWLVTLGLGEAIPELQDIAQERHFPEGSKIFAAGDLPAGLFLLRSGRVRLSLPLDQQGNLISQTIMPGELLGLSEAVSGKPHELTATAESPSEAVLLPRTKFLKIMLGNPKFGLSVSAFISTQVEGAYDRIRMVRSRKPGAEPGRSQRPRGVAAHSRRRRSTGIGD